jgi:hypothetical protein
MSKDSVLHQVAVVDIGVEGRNQKTPGRMAVEHRGAAAAGRARTFELVHTVHMDCWDYWDCSRQADLSRSLSLRRG